MGRVFKSNDKIQAQDFMNRYFSNKTGKRNQNVIGVTTGATGSGKTYVQLSIAEGWYENNYANSLFPIENVCFSLSALMRRINSLSQANKLRRGELLILEEAGANFGNLDFQMKLSKMFSYILQSFRSMNLVLLMNVPVITMINKSARQLVHFHMTTHSINLDTNTTKVKCLFHQLSQSTGKSYWKYPRVNQNGKFIAIQRMNFPCPSQRIIDLYEREKFKFVTKLTEEFIDKAAELEQEKELKASRSYLSTVEQITYDILIKGKTMTEAAAILEKSISAVSATVKRITKKGFSIKKPKKIPVLNVSM